MKKLYIILLLVGIFFNSKAQDTINVPADFSTIQAAIDTAKNGDVILVSKGIYVENINFKGKNIIVGSLFLTTEDTSYISQTIIDGNGGNREPSEKRSVVTFENGEDSTAYLCGFTITNGSVGATWLGIGWVGWGGGITCLSSSPTLSNLYITKNNGYYGGGIYFSNCQSRLISIIVTENTARYGGGIFLVGFSAPIFDNVHRSSIFLNTATFGSDLYKMTSQKISIILDTFTVIKPTDYHAYPKNRYDFNIKNAKIQQVNSDLYVNPKIGDNRNSGLSPEYPLKTISFSMKKIYADSLNPKTIYLANGVYSTALTGEFYPISLCNYVSLQGETEKNVILEKEGYDTIISLGNDLNHDPIDNVIIKGLKIENLTLKGSGETTGIFIMDSNPELKNITMDEAMLWLSNSNPIIENVKISGNTEEAGILMYGSSPTLMNVLITNNSGWLASGLRCEENSHAQLINCTISGNNSSYEGIGGIHITYESSISIINSIICNNPGYEIGVNDGGDFPNVSIIVTNSLIEGGINGIHHIHSGGTVYWLNGNINTDPLFYDPSYEDFRLQNNSPCIDAGIQDTMIVFNNGKDTLNIPSISFNGLAPDIGAFEFGSIVGIEEINSLLRQFRLDQNYPNPFNPTTTINYSIPKQSYVTLKVYDILGREAATLVNEEKPAGTYTVRFGVGQDSSPYISSGIYFYQIKAGNYVSTKKMILLR